MKKKLLPLFVLAVFTLATAVTACANPTHEHKWGEWITVKEATCEEAGERKRTCADCGEEESEEVGGGHVWKLTLSYDDGKHWYDCENCDERKSEGKHQFLLVSSTPAQCEADGEDVLECACGKTKTEVLEAFGHDYEIKAGSDDKLGKHWEECFTCHDKINEADCEYEFKAQGDTLVHHSVCKECNQPQLDGDAGIVANHTFASGSDVCSGCGYEQVYTKGLTYELDRSTDTYTVTGIGTANVTDIVIPAYYEGKRVTAIGESAFENEGSISSVVIADSVESIEWSAFSGCTNLDTVTIGKSVKAIARAAFNKSSGKGIDRVNYTGTAEDWCRIKFAGENSNPLFYSTAGTRYIWLGKNEKLENVVVPDDVTAISPYAFYQCESIKSIKLGSGVKSIGDSAFYICSSLTDFDFGDSEPTSIGGKAFYRCSLTSFDMPDSVTSMGYNVFQNCMSLQTVKFSDGMDKVANETFYDCIALQSFTGGNGTTIIGTDAFNGCISLKNAPLREGITAIWKNAFRNCVSLNNVVLPSTLESIYDGAFQDCEKISSITIPAKCGSIGASAFSGCKKLADVTIEEGSVRLTLGITLFMYCAIKEIVIPDRVTTLGKEIFYGCSDMTKITIGVGVTSIGANIFFGCTSLSDITIPSDNTALLYSGNCLIDKKAKKVILGFANSVIPESADVVTAIGKGAFMKVEIESIDIPENITSIEEQAFRYCTSLTSVKLPNSVTTLSDFVFADCASLSRVTLGNNLSVIGKSAFKDCTSLASFTIPDTVTVIGASAFSGCTELVTAVGENVTSIGQFAFQGCTKSVTVEKGITYIGKWVIGFDKSASALTAEMFKADTVGIAGGAFNFAKLTSVDLSGSAIKYIDDEAFSENDDLTSVTLPSSLIRLGNRAFYNCVALTSITIPASVTEIGYLAFGCDLGKTMSLASVVLEEKTGWKTYSFSDDYGLAAWSTDVKDTSPADVAAALKTTDKKVWKRTVTEAA